MNQVYEALKKDFFKEIEKNLKQAFELSDYLADHPELSGEEFQSSQRMVNLLRSHSFDVEYPFDGIETAFRGIWGSNNHKRKIALLTEYDALPELGHACGHCVSGAISLLSGIALKGLQDPLDADIHVVGTPVEETDGAKVKMVKDGIFDEYDMAIMLHMYDCNVVAPVALALDTYIYEFQGKAAHSAAAPWEGKNAFNGLQLFFHAMDMLRQHVKPDVRIHGIITHGGEAPNIVPQRCTAEVYLRALDRNYLDQVVEKVDCCAQGAAIATQTTWKKTCAANSYDHLKYNKTGTQALEEAYVEMGKAPNGDPNTMFGSTDTGNVSLVCPTFHGGLQLVDSGTPIHTREFAQGVKGKRAHDTLERGAKIIGLQIIKIFSDQERYQAMIKDFQEK